MSSMTVNMQNLVFFLKTEVSSGIWKRLLLTYRFGALELDLEEAFKFCLKRKIIQKDLINLSVAFQSVERDDLASKLQPYMLSFSEMSDTEFENYFLFVTKQNKKKHYRYYTEDNSG